MYNSPSRKIVRSDTKKHIKKVDQDQAEKIDMLGRNLVYKLKPKQINYAENHILEQNHSQIQNHQQFNQNPY